MDDFTKQFVEWMDTHNLSPKDISVALGAEIQTIRQWRSLGVPRRRVPHLTIFMKNWGKFADAPVSGSQSQPLTLYPSTAQFRRWGDAAAARGKNVLDWAMEELEAAAAEEELHKSLPNLYKPERNPTSTPPAPSVDPPANGQGVA